MSRVISQAVAPGGVSCSPAGSLGSESRSSHPGALVSLIAALASLGGGFSPWAVPPALLLGALGLFAAAPASADVLVSNIAQTQTFQVELGPQSNARAQQFTTGTGWGYTLSSIDIKFHTAVGTPANLRVELWSALTAGNPNKKLADLTVPATVGTGAVTFAAPASTVLNGRTKYFVVVYRSGTTTGELAKASSDAEDAGAAAGWSITNADHRIPSGQTSWIAGGQSSLQIRVNGRTVPSLGRPGRMSTPGLYPLGPGRLKIAEGASITYPIAIDQPPTADLTITPRHHNVRPDGSDYPEVDNGLLTIHNAVTFPAQSILSTDWMNPKSVRLTAVDDNECKSPPGTRYWIRHYGSGGGPDWGDWRRQDRHHGVVISIEIIDDDCKYLAASSGHVYPEEGGSATYTVRLKEPLEDTAYIVPRISVPGDSDPGTITVSPERIRVEAGDTSPKTFTVSAGRDANSRNEVLIVDHSVDSPEVPADYLGARVTVIVQDEQNAARTQERDPLSVTGLALTAGSEAVALSPAFSTDVLSYRAEVPAGTSRVTLAPQWSGGASVHAGSRRGGTTFTRPSRVRPSGTAVDLALAPDGGATELWVMASGGPGGMTTYRIEVTEAQVREEQTAETPEEQTPPEEEAAQTVTVAFSNVPPEHDGRTAFALEVQSGSKPAVEAFKVTNGKVTGVESLDPVLWRVRVKPKSWKDVKIALGAASATVRGPARIRVADAKGREGKDASLDFAVTLSRAATGPVSVDYATEDGTATAGADYTAVSGTLTFAAGETTKTVSVTLLDDAVDEGKETFKLKLSNPRGAYLRAMHREAKGVIRNADPLPSAWQIRFGRSVSQQVVDALQQRFSTTTTPSGLQLTLAGETLTSDTPLEENHVLLSRLLGFESVSSQEVAQGSSFSFSPEGAGPRLSFWGKGALSSFNGVEESVTLTGDVTTALLGAEWNNERWRAGAALSHSWGNGSYQGEGDGADGRISSTLTGIFPYGRYALTPRLGVWATAGYGWGSLSLNPDGDAPEYNPATTMTLGAVGMDGLLLDGGSEGVTLTTTADALFLKTTSEAVVGLASSEGNISRLRLGLEATRSFTLSNGASLSPSLEVGLRQDSGDAETGFGMDLGAGLSWSAPQQGITATVKGRTLLSHGAEDFQDQGLALSFSWQPSPSNRGASLSLSHAVGLPADGGMAALLNPTAIELPDDASNGGEQFEARLAYGFPFYNNRLTLTPSVATALSTNSRSYSLLWSLAPYGEQLLGEPWELSLEGERQEHSSSSTVDHSLKLLFSLPL